MFTVAFSQGNFSDANSGNLFSQLAVEVNGVYRAGVLQVRNTTKLLNNGIEDYYTHTHSFNCLGIANITNPAVRANMLDLTNDMWYRHTVPLSHKGTVFKKTNSAFFIMGSKAVLGISAEIRIDHHAPPINTVEESFSGKILEDLVKQIIAKNP